MNTPWPDSRTSQTVFHRFIGTTTVLLLRYTKGYTDLSEHAPFHTPVHGIMRCADVAVYLHIPMEFLDTYTTNSPPPPHYSSSLGPPFHKAEGKVGGNDPCMVGNMARITDSGYTMFKEWKRDRLCKREEAEKVAREMLE